MVLWMLYARPSQLRFSMAISHPATRFPSKKQHERIPMPITLELLGGVSCEAQPVTSTVVTGEYKYTRKKNRDSRPPREKDTFAFRWNGVADPVEVVRSPLNHESWVTTKGREIIVAELLAAGWAFEKRKGFTMVPPKKAGSPEEEKVFGWLKLPGNKWRSLYQHSGYGWNKVFRMFDDGY